MELNRIVIRETTPNDTEDILNIHRLAFGEESVAVLTASLFVDPTAQPMVSLLALHEGKPIGHILFTAASLQDNPLRPKAQILAPLAVIPDFQKMGVGGLLIAEGVRILHEMGTELVFVLGHMEYYPRHGFIPNAGRLGYPAPYPIDEKHADYWMVRPIGDKGFEAGAGKVLCAQAMDAPEHWSE